MMEKPKNLACFVAGTPVWTDKGTVPIEKIKVGDLVLSKCEHTGVQAYKRVTRTFKKEKQKIYPLAYALEENGKRKVEVIFCTEDHPFWEKNSGWLSAHQINEFFGDLDNQYVSDYFSKYKKLPSPLLQTKDGKDVTAARPDLFKTYPVIAQMCPNPSRGLVHIGYYDRDAQLMECIFDGKKSHHHYDPIYEVYNPEVCDTLFHGVTILSDDLTTIEENYPVEWHLKHGREFDELFIDVYNIEVEDFHTYYVGELGVWVHNACDIRSHLNVFKRA